MNKKPSKLEIIATVVLMFAGYLKLLELISNASIKLCNWLENRRRKEVSDDGCSNGSAVDPDVFEGFEHKDDMVMDGMDNIYNE